MPLKLVKRKGQTAWYIRGTVRGKTVFESTGTSDQALAEGFRIKREGEAWQEAVHGRAGTHTFADAAASYLNAEARSRSTAIGVRKLIVHFGKTRLARISQESLDPAYRALLVAGVRSSPATKVRGVITPLQAVLEHAAVMGWCSRPSFKKPRIPKTATNFLLPGQVNALLAGAADHLRPMLTFLAATGVRLSEALELQWAKVDLRGKRAVVWQKQGNERRIDLCPRAVAALAALPYRDGYVFRPIITRKLRGKRHAPPAYGESYRNSDQGGGQIKTAWATACRNAGLPGQWREWKTKAGKVKRQWVSEITPHDLRHTWASWFYCVHKDLLKLQAAGGWATLPICGRYAHMMPDAYQDEIVAWWTGVPALVEKTA